MATVESADVVHTVGADDLDGARRTLLDAVDEARGRLREMSLRNEEMWARPATVVAAQSAAAVLADPVCLDAAEYIARMGRVTGHRLTLHGSADEAWTLAEFGGSYLLRDYAHATPVVEYVPHPRWTG